MKIDISYKELEEMILQYYAGEFSDGEHTRIQIFSVTDKPSKFMGKDKITIHVEEV